MELKPEELEAKNTADQQWLAGINSSYISCRGSFIGLKHTTIAKMFRRCEECIELRSAVIAQAAEIARLRSELSIANRSLRYYQDTLTIGDMGKYWALEGGGATAAIDPERLGDVLKERDRLRVQVEHFRAKNCDGCDRIASEEGEVVRERLIAENRALKARVTELEKFEASMRCPNCDNLRLEIGQLRRRVAELEANQIGRSE